MKKIVSKTDGALAALESSVDLNVDTPSPAQPVDVAPKRAKAQAIDIADLTRDSHPIAAANADSWPKARAPRGLKRDQKIAAAIKAADPAAKDKAPSNKAAKADPKSANKLKAPARKATKPVAPKGGRTSAKEAAMADALAGKLPPPPVFSAHPCWNSARRKAAPVVALVEKGDLKALKALTIPTYCTSVIRIGKYRDLAVIALEARAKAPKAAKGVDAHV
jgi:hypothetical protein